MDMLLVSSICYVFIIVTRVRSVSKFQILTFSFVNCYIFELLAPALPGGVLQPYGYEAQHSRNGSAVNVITVAEMQGDQIKVQHQVG